MGREECAVRCAGPPKGNHSFQRYGKDAKPRSAGEPEAEVPNSVPAEVITESPRLSDPQAFPEGNHFPLQMRDPYRSE